MALKQKAKNKHPPQYFLEWRQHRKLTQDKAAELIGMDRGNLSKLERGKISFTVDSLARIAKAYRCEIPDLFSPPAKPAKQERPNDIELFAALAQVLFRGIERNDLVANELSQVLVRCYEAATARGIQPQDRNALELLLETEVRRLVALSSQ